MRIVSGLYKGRRLNVPKNNNIRPTTDKIRGAMFNMLDSRGAIDGAYTLDAFCGSGALGLEALSRGAEFCRFMDKVRDSLSLARENAEMLGADENSKFLLKDTMKIGCKPNSERSFDLIFLDPPYNKGLVEKSLGVLSDGGWISKDAYIVCEMEKRSDFSLPSAFELDDERVYGDIKVMILRYQPIIPV